MHALKQRLSTINRARKQKRTISRLKGNPVRAFPSTEPARDRTRASQSFLAPTALQAPRAYPEIDLSIVTYDSARWLPMFLRSLRAQRYPTRKLHLRIVDHASSDGSPEVLTKFLEQHAHEFASVSFSSQANVGFGAGHNRALAGGNAPWCLVTNVDLEFRSDTIERLVACALAADDRVAAVEARQSPYEHPKAYDPVTLETVWNSHACVLLRRAAFEQTGGYEPRIFMYGEDVDLSLRLRGAGWTLLYCPYAVVAHYTYEGPNHRKPLQEQRALLVQTYLSLRFGNWRDIACAVGSYLCRLLRPSRRSAGIRAAYLAQLQSLVRDGPHFLRSRKHWGRVAFRGGQCAPMREGAFHEVVEVAQDVRVSVLIRTCAGRGFMLRQALRSVANQTYRNLEVVVAEDGADCAEAHVREFIETSGLPARFLACPKRGRSHAGNRALEAASGQLCVFLDDDDLFFPDHLETLVAAFKSQPQAVAVYSLAWELPGDIDYASQTYTECSAIAHRSQRMFDYARMLDTNFIPIQCVAFRRSLFTCMGGFDESLEYLEDWNLWLRYSMAGDFICVPKTTSLYRVVADTAKSLVRTQSMRDAYQPSRNQALGSVRALLADHLKI